MQDYSFQMLEPGSGSYESNSRWCPGLEQPSAKAQSMRPLDGRFNFLLILGAQKAGTTWLFDALDTHPLFVGATHGYRCFADLYVVFSCDWLVLCFDLCSIDHIVVTVTRVLNVH